MALKNIKNVELNKKFNKYFPCGHTNFKSSIEATRMRVFQTRAEGSRFWDADGNQYIDYMGALGPNILGHRHPEYIKSLQDYMNTMSPCIGSGIVFSEDDIVVAEKLVQHIPCAEQVKFCVSGSEAVQMAIRLARAYTGRPYFLRFGGHYHGWFDNIFGGMPDPNPMGKPYPVKEDDDLSGGIYPGATNQGLMIPWNDFEALEETLNKYGEEIAIIHFEALVCNCSARFPRPGFIERIRELCDKYGIVMSIDEVITGFRVGLSGAQGMFGVTPDICTLGKAIGGGLPISAVVGKEKILNLLKESKVLGPGTFNGNPLCMRAVRTTIEILERDSGFVYKDMNRVQQPLMAGLREIAQRRGVPMRVQGTPSVFYTLFGVNPDIEQYTDADIAGYDTNMNLKFWENMAEQGIYTLAVGRWYPTISHSDYDTECVLEVADKVMAKL